MLGFALGALPSERATAWGRFGALRPIIALVAVAAIIPQYVILASGSHLSNSQDAFNAGNAARARSEALGAKAIEPWAASPYLQLAFIADAEHNHREAVRWGHEAIRRAPRNWKLWAALANFETRAGNIPAAKRALAGARRLNTHSLGLPPPKGG
jgi:hypothetical protein